MQAGEAQWGTDEAAIQAILCSRSYNQLRATFKAYEGIAGRDIEEAIQEETSGSLQDGYLAISESQPACVTSQLRALRCRL